MSFNSDPFSTRMIINDQITRCIVLTILTESLDPFFLLSAPCLDPSDPNVQYQLWSFDAPGITAITSSSHNVCLDFGDQGDVNGLGMKVWTCYPGLNQQTVEYTE